MTYLTRMNSEYKTKWISALRSGDYKQGMGLLRVGYNGESSWCCLGVLCDVVNPLAWEKVSDLGYYHHEQEQTTTLPFDLAHRIDLHYSAVGILIKMNDLHRATFPEIADWINRHL